MARKVTIAIMTYWGYNDNYGQLMQAYALSTYLKKLGYEPRLIRYDHMNDTSLKRSLVSRIYTMAYKPSQLFKGILDRVTHLFSKSTYLSCPCADSFETFKKRHLDWTQYYPNYQSLVENPPSADIYICGSDMIWAESAFKPDPFYLNFGNPKKRVAYAPSFGRNSISKPFAKYISPLLQQFDAISVREDSGVKICEQSGRYDAVCVPDPTLLLEKEDYSSLEEVYPSPSNYVFAYILGENGQQNMQEIKQYAERHNYELVYRCAQGALDDDFPKAYPTPGQWLSLIRNASIVFTNSFHGVIFSIIYRKSFMYLPITGKSASSNERVYSILEKLKLSDRIGRPIKIKNPNEIYTEEIEEKINSFICKGRDFFEQNLC